MVPRVSVCIPTYNGAAFLAETLDSAVTQTFDDFEVVIVDDCSTDESFAIAERFARSDPRVRAIRNAERAGSGAPTRRSISRTRAASGSNSQSRRLMAPTCLANAEASTRGPLVICWHDYRSNRIDPDLRGGESPDARQRAARRFRRSGSRLRGGLRRPTTNFIGPTSSVSSIATASRNTDRSIRPFVLPDLDFWTRVGAEGISIAPEPCSPSRARRVDQRRATA
jgi:glycosyltransferase involved in cell wall biosynthesis